MFNLKGFVSPWFTLAFELVCNKTVLLLCAISGYPLQRSHYSVKEGEWLSEDNVQFPF